MNGVDGWKMNSLRKRDVNLDGGKGIL